MNINVGFEHLFGVARLAKYSPVAGDALANLLDLFLKSMDSPLTVAERELIFTQACWVNGSKSLAGLHSQCAALHPEMGDDVIEVLRYNGPCALAGEKPKLHELLHIAADVAVSIGGTELQMKMETPDSGAIALARAQGISDREIHDAVLIASFACMMTRYVDALAPESPDDRETYRRLAQEIHHNSYRRSLID